jgi:hypothetical protein
MRSADRNSWTLSKIKFTITGVNQADFLATSTCASTLSPAATCATNVTFTPQGTGSRQGTLTVKVTGTPNPAPVPLRGTGD